MDLFNYQNQNIKNHFQRSIRIDNELTKEFLDHYNRISKSNPGSAIVKVDRGVCQGCLVKLPMSEINKIRLAENPIIGSCCNRLLIFSN